MKYIVLHLGETDGVVYESEKDAMEEVRYIVSNYIHDHYRHYLPFSVEDDEYFEPDVEVFVLNEAVPLPLQELADEFYWNQKIYEKEESEREYKRYLELKKMYETD